jgi:hypothetical protein
MRTAVASIILLLAVMAHAQSIICPSKPNFYVYNNRKDTIHFTKVDLGRGLGHTTFKVIDSIQIDGLGRNELVFYREGARFVSEHGGTFDITESRTFSKYEIWNLDTKTLLFEAISARFYDYDIFRPGLSMQPRKGTEEYSYHFTVDKSGKITISNYIGTSNTNPDHKVGTYTFVHGKYIKSEP